MQEQAVQQQPKRVALVGFAPTTRHLAPVDDPTIEIWSLNEAYTFLGRCDRWFQMHPRWEWETSLRDTGYVDWMKASAKPIYMFDHERDIPASVRYPIEDVIAGIDGVEYLTSSFSYMLGLALLEGFTEIHIYGVDLVTDEEYGYQRAGAEFLLGVALGRGVSIVIPEACPLLKSPLYGQYEKDRVRSLFTKQMIELRGEQLTGLLNEVLQSAHTLNGAVQALRHLRGLQAENPEVVEIIDKELVALTAQHQAKQQAILETQGALKECGNWLVRLVGEVRADANRDPDAPVAEMPPVPTPAIPASDGTGAKELVHVG